MVGTGQGGRQVILCILCMIYVSQNEIIIVKSLHSGRPSSGNSGFRLLMQEEARETDKAKDSQLRCGAEGCRVWKFCFASLCWMSHGAVAMVPGVGPFVPFTEASSAPPLAFLDTWSQGAPHYGPS